SIHRLSGAPSSSGRADNFVGRESVVVLQLRGSVNPSHICKSGEWHHRTGAIAHVDILDVIRRHSKWSIKLDNHPLDAIAIDEIIDIADPKQVWSALLISPNATPSVLAFPSSISIFNWAAS